MFYCIFIPDCVTFTSVPAVVFISDHVGWGCGEAEDADQEEEEAGGACNTLPSTGHFHTGTAHRTSQDLRHDLCQIYSVPGNIFTFLSFWQMCLLKYVFIRGFMSAAFRSRSELHVWARSRTKRWQVLSHNHAQTTIWRYNATKHQRFLALVPFLQPSEYWK